MAWRNSSTPAATPTASNRYFSTPSTARIARLRIAIICKAGCSSLNGTGPSFSRYFQCTTAAAHLDFQLAPHRHMVGGFFPSPHVLVDAAGDEAVGGLRRQKDVVDADAAILLPAAGGVIPKRIELRLRVAGPDGVGVAEIFQPSERRPRFRLEQRVHQPILGLVNVFGRGDDVVVAH